MNTIKTINTRDAVKYQWFGYFLVGANPPEYYSSYYNYYFYYVYAVMINSFITIYYPLSLIIGLFLLDSFQSILECMSQIFIETYCSLKILNYMIYRKQLKSIDEFMKILDKRIEMKDEKLYIRQIIKLSKSIYIFYLTLYSSTIILSGIIAFVNKPIKILYPAWFPFDWTASLQNWYIAYTYQFGGLLLQGFQNVCNDTYPICYLLVLTSHFRMLKNRIRKIGYDKDTTKEDNYKTLINCVQDYDILLRYHKTLETVISYSLFYQYIVTGAEICISGVYLLFIERNPIKSIYMILLVACSVCEIMVLCYIGSNLEIESDNLTTAIYECNWMDQNVVFRKTIIRFMQRTQKNSKIRAGNWLNVNLAGFMGLIRVTYSILAVAS